MFILKCAEQTSSCTSRRALCVGEREREGGTEMYLCSIWGGNGARHTLYCILVCLTGANEKGEIHNKKEKHAS